MVGIYRYFGDSKPVENGIKELRINYAKGYRVYFKEKDGRIIFLLIGGNKSTQKGDIKKANEILENALNLLLKYSKNIYTAKNFLQGIVAVSAAGKMT
jgi:hypothetical protein